MSNIISSGNELLKFNSDEVIEVSEGLPIPMPTMWLSADVGIVKDGDDKVSQWQDQSGNDYHAGQASQANKPLLVDGELNGKPVLRFSDNNMLDVSFDTVFSQPFVFFIVFKTNTNSRSVIISSDAVLATGIDVDISNFSSPFRYQIRSCNLYNTLFTSLSLDTYYLTSNVWDGSQGKIYVNSQFASTGNTATNPIDNTLRIGARFQNDRYMNGDIAEIIFYNSLLSNPQRQSVEQYLMTKYAL